MNKINYQKKTDEELAEIIKSGKRPRLLLHSCCAPCSSYCLVYLRRCFDITCFYYNPNITEKDEYDKRVAELYKLAELLNDDPIVIERDANNQPSLCEKGRSVLNDLGKVSVITGKYEPEEFMKRVSEGSLQNEPEGGKRCKMCFSLRLSEGYKTASELGFDYFTTSLTISPLKDAQILNSIGEAIAKNGNGTKWLYSDFKKQNGYKMSVELSGRYGLYRQNYCGCVYSKQG